MENKITKRTDLLDRKGHVIKPGYATKMLYNYNKENIKAHPSLRTEGMGLLSNLLR